MYRNHDEDCTYAVNDDGDCVPYEDVYGPKEEPEQNEECVMQETDNESVSVDYSAYWQSCLAICDAVGRYQRTKKLLTNYTHEETHHRVSHVVDNPKYFGGSTGKVKNSRENRRQEVLRTVEEHNAFCREYKLVELDPDAVIVELGDGGAISRYRERIKRRLERNIEPVAFFDIPSHKMPPAPRKKK